MPLLWPWEGNAEPEGGKFNGGPALQPQGVPLETRWCIGTVHHIYLVTNNFIIEVTLFFLECSIDRYKFMYSNSCTATT